ncbi:uncharacterized protein LOC113378221 [Ctenocephalides felis]|uniref:uncharacterized protein LOC113378221 n=1 Tax=Ctenocephalides felis TaxID=7515 RepID=UPI000E6E1A5B|nr:uncharacterized protein LOC113378221 [Ctenocephalides felis]
MSNFQRTRSKVWWDSEDDYPTTYQAPKTPQNAQNVSNSSQNTTNNLNKNEHSPIDNQILQKYLAENQNVRDVPTYYEEQQSASPNHQLSGDKNVVENLDSSKNNLEGFQNLSPGSPRPYPRMLRAASPASHRSQDSGFSDSDCSPAQTAPKPIKREENWQRVIESLRISKSSDAICSRNDQAVVNDVKVSTSNGIDFESQLDENFWKNLKAPKKSNTSTPNTIAQFNSIQKGFTPDLQKIQLTPLKNFMQTHQDDKKVEPKNNIIEKSKSVDVDISNVQRRPKLLSVRSCPDGRTNSVHRLIYKFDHGESPLPGFKPSVTKNQTDEDNSKNISHVEVLSNTKTKDDTLDKNNLIADTLTKSNMSSFEVYRHVPKNISRKIEYIDYSQMCCGPINEEGYTADQSTVSLSPEMFHEKLDELNFSNVSTLSEDLPDGHKTSLNLTGSPLYQSRLFEETDRNSMIQDNELNMAKIVSPKKRTDTFSQGAMDDSYFYKKRQGLANKSLPNPRSDKNGARYKLNLTLSAEKLGNTPQIIAESDANNVTTVSVNSYNSIDDYDILYSKKPEPNNNTVEITTTPENMCHVTCANKKSQETEIADAAFSTPANAKKCYNNETYELQLPSSSKPYAGTYDQNVGGKLSDEITLPSSDSDLAPSCTSTPKWYKPSEVKQLTPVSHRKIAVHRRVNLLAGFNAAPEDSDKENSPKNEDENKVGIKIVDGKVWVKSKSTNCEKDMVPSSTGSRSNTPDRSGPKDIFEEERPGDVTPKFNKEADKNIFEENRTPKIKKDKNLLTKIFGKRQHQQTLYKTIQTHKSV